jgi:hypothetical protein
MVSNDVSSSRMLSFSILASQVFRSKASEECLL